jgi:hypothetical protein
MCCVCWHIQTSENYPKYEKLMVALCVCTRHIPPYTTIYRHMTVYASICRDIRVSGFHMYDVGCRWSRLVYEVVGLDLRYCRSHRYFTSAKWGVHTYDQCAKSGLVTILHIANRFTDFFAYSAYCFTYFISYSTYCIAYSAYFIAYSAYANGYLHIYILQFTYSAYFLSYSAYFIPYSAYFIPYSAFFFPYSAFFFPYYAYFCPYSAYFLPYSAYFFPYSVFVSRPFLPGLYSDCLQANQLFNQRTHRILMAILVQPQLSMAILASPPGPGSSVTHSGGDPTGRADHLLGPTALTRAVLIQPSLPSVTQIFLSPLQRELLRNFGALSLLISFGYTFHGIQRCISLLHVREGEVPENMIDIAVESCTNQRHFLCFLAVPLVPVEKNNLNMQNIKNMQNMQSLHTQFAGQELINVSFGPWKKFGQDLLK